MADQNGSAPPQAPAAPELPAPVSQPLEGTTTLDTAAGSMADLVAYQAMRGCAQRIAETIDGLLEGTGSCKILVVDNLQFLLDDYYLIQTDLQLDLFDEAFSVVERNFQHVAPPDPAAFEVGATLVALSSVAGLMADLIGYFRSDYAVKGREVKLSDDALRAAVAGRITEAPVQLLDFSLMAESPLLAKLRARYARRFELERRKELLDAKRAQLEQAVAGTGSAVAKLREQLAQIDPADAVRRQQLENSIAQSERRMERDAAAAGRIQAALAEWAALSKSFDAFLGATVAVGEEQKRPTLLVALARDQIRRGKVTHLLYLRVVSSGGEAITRRNLFFSGRVAYLGGCAVTYTLATVDGAAVAADTCTAAARLDDTLGGEGVATLRMIRLES
jgi:hypothetical protein